MALTEELLPKPLTLPPIDRADRAGESAWWYGGGDGSAPVALVPLFYAALLFFSGIVAAHFLYLRPDFLLAGLLPIAAIALMAIARAPRLVWLPIAAIWVTLGSWSAEMEPAPSADPAIALLSDGLLRTVEGTVVDAGPVRGHAVADEDSDDRDNDGTDPQQDERTQRIDVELSAAEVVTDGSDAIVPVPKSDGDRIRLTVVWPSPRETPMVCGERLRAVVRMLPPESFHDPGVWSRAVYLESQEIAATGTATAAKRYGAEAALVRLGDSGTHSAACLLSEARNVASARLLMLPELMRALPRWLRATPEDSAMLTAMLTGDRSFLTRGLRAGFERTGSFHLIVVSGLHLAILAGCVFALARRLRLGRVPATASTIAVALAYALFTGFAVPVQRSFWMIALYLVGRLLYRNRSPLNVIGFAALCLAAASPRSIFDAGLQMTLLSVAAIAGVALPLLDKTLHARVQATGDLRLVVLDPKLPPKIAQFRVTMRLIARHLEAAFNYRFAWKVFPFAVRSALRLGELVFVALVVELALALPMAIYFHRITVYALPVNLCILPLLAVLLPMAMLLLVVLTVWPVLAVVPACACLMILHASVFVVRRLGAGMLGDLRVPDPARLQIAAAILLFVLALQLARGCNWQRRLSFAAVALMALAALWPRPVDHPDDGLLFEAIDVGQGDSLLLITPDGKTLLVDGGGLGFVAPGVQSSRTDFDVGDEVVSAVLWSRGIRRLDAVALTHGHHDHMGGLPAVLRNFHPRELWVGNNPPVPAYRELLEEAAKLKVPVRQFHAGEEFAFGQAVVRVLAPLAGYRPGAEPANDDSLVLQARYRAAGILLAGDAEAPEEQAMLSESELRSTLLKVGHHGSLTSTRPAFLAAVAPRWAVISCGRRNRFGHPRPEILAELQAAHVRTYRTDTGGAACFVLNGESGTNSVTPEPMCVPRR